MKELEIIKPNKIICFGGIAYKSFKKLSDLNLALIDKTRQYLGIDTPTVLASEIIKNFYKNKKILVLCHRLVLLEQLERELKIDHKVRKLGISEDVKEYGDADIILSTNLRSKYAIASLIPESDLNP